jgi:hypothetical protein
MKKNCLHCNDGFKGRKTSKYCSQSCAGKHRKPNQLGLKRSEATKELQRQKAIERGAMPPCGIHSPMYKGGVTLENEKIRKSARYRNWRTKIFKRDDYTCQECGQRGRRLNADHIKPFALFPELRFKLSNGRTLCEECHRQTDTYGVNTKYYATQ